MKDHILAGGKRLYKKLPTKYQKTAWQYATPFLYKKNTTGIVPDDVMVSWARKYARPVSVVIPSYNDYTLLKACIESIEKTCRLFTYEIIVVDDYCQPTNSEKLKTLSSDVVRVIFKDERQGFAKTVNRGMREAKYDIVLLNSDIVAQPGWLEALQYSAYEIDKSIGMVSPKLVYPDGRIQYGGTYYARVIAPQWFGHLFVGRPATTAVANVPFYNRSISGACAYIKQSTYSELGGLDETYWLGFEDVDYGLKAWQRGIRCYYQPASMLVHYESASRGYSQGMRELGSMRYFWTRWGDLFLRRSTTLKSVDYVISNASSSLWQQYIREQAAALRAVGLDVSIHKTTTAKDEHLINQITARDSLKICCDHGAVTNVWLSSLNAGKAVYLLPDIESSHYAEEPATQAEIIARYRPEFDYIAPSCYVGNQLQRETAWRASAQVVPAICPPVEVGTPVKTVVVIDDSGTVDESLEKVINDNGYRVKRLATTEVTPEYITKAASCPPAVFVVCDRLAQQSLRDMSLLGLAPIVGYRNDKTQYEILDGYNALLADTSDGITRLLRDILTDDNARQELRNNGRLTASYYATLNREVIRDVLELIARTAV